VGSLLIIDTETIGCNDGFMYICQMCKDTKSYEHVNEHTTGRNILTENYHIDID
jgi:hypothetical protein